ncbi:hypothetical protein ZIOFF_003858 [Zingiber officinale]|uniref:Transcription repressor n=1 Tax=Zingiber officinale TaxID=94328 RepID=A0A8J5INF8_ZINOF|nr:hypothetical protein ZIOFF_003858 [Zingiber officinale]
MERLKSSLKSLHGAITDVKPTAPTFFHLHGNDSPTTSSNPSLVDQSYLTMPSSYSSSSSSSSRTIRAVDDIESFSLGKVSSKRFFFSPLTTNSIMEEAKLKAANGDYSRGCSFCNGCTTIAIASRDPYRDFRTSMEEMVAAHGLRDWPRLEELLHCYLRLNEEKHHRVICTSPLIPVHACWVGFRILPKRHMVLLLCEEERLDMGQQNVSASSLPMARHGISCIG